MGKPTAAARRTKVPYGQVVVRPYALAGSKWEAPLAGLCALLLGTVFVLELLTPDAVVGAFALLPLLAAMWLLSSRLAAVVALVAVLQLGVTLVAETANRPTIILVSIVTLATSIVARLYATGLAYFLSRNRHPPPAMPAQAKVTTLAGIDRFSHGISSLTPRELEVARLAAQGYTAAEIGDQLHIGNRTVESHLASTYSKLRIQSRRQLIRMASGLGNSMN